MYGVTANRTHARISELLMELSLTNIQTNAGTGIEIRKFRALRVGRYENRINSRSECVPKVRVSRANSRTVMEMLREFGLRLLMHRRVRVKGRIF